MAPYRFVTQNALTGDILAWNLPLHDAEFGPELNGPGSLKATLEPHLAHLLRNQLDPGNTLIYAERDGTLLWGGIIWRAEPEGGAYPIEAAGFSSYLTRRHDLHGNLGGRGPYTYADPCQVIRDVWAYTQEQPDGDLGVTVPDTTSEATTGTPAEPYASAWWEAPELGDIVRDMTEIEGGPEYTETVAWHEGRPHREIRLGWPRLGTRRTDVSFTSGVNVATTVPIIYDADDYAQVVVALGAGEGRARRRATSAARNGRLRLEHIVETSEKGTDRLADRARTERTARQVLGDVTEIRVRDHPAARIGSWQVGDDVRVRLHDQWADFDGWCRITGWTLAPPAGDDHETITIQLKRADRFTYGG